MQNIRRHTNADLKSLLKEKAISEEENMKAQDEIQELGDFAIKNIDSLLASKEKEMMEF